MGGEISLDSGSSTANNGTGESSTPNQWLHLGHEEPSSNAAVMNLLQDDAEAEGELTILTRFRDTIFHQLKHAEFTQQELPARKPMITPNWAMIIFLAVALVTMPIGIITLAVSNHVVEIVHRYDTECTNKTVTNPVSFIQSQTSTTDVTSHSSSPSP